MKGNLLKQIEKKNELGEKPLVGWDVGFGMQKSDLQTPWCHCCGSFGNLSLHCASDM